VTFVTKDGRPSNRMIISSWTEFGPFYKRYNRSRTIKLR